MTSTNHVYSLVLSPLFTLVFNKTSTGYYVGGVVVVPTYHSDIFWMGYQSMSIIVYSVVFYLFYLTSDEVCIAFPK